MPLSGELAEMLRAAARRSLARHAIAVRRCRRCGRCSSVQRKWSAIPNAAELLIERVKSREGWHLFFFPFEGRLVHEGLAALFAYRMSRMRADHLLDVIERLRLRAHLGRRAAARRSARGRIALVRTISSTTFRRR